MTRAGILSSGYKFKVLSLDPRGRQYLIMMDLTDQSAGDAAQGIGADSLQARRQHVKINQRVRRADHIFTRS